MIIPARGTLERSVLDLIASQRMAGFTKVTRSLNNIARPVLQRIIDTLVTKGLIYKSGTCYSVYPSIKQDILKEEEAINNASTFKPLQTNGSWRDKVGRPGAMDFMSWKSKHT